MPVSWTGRESYGHEKISGSKSGSEFKERVPETVWISGRKTVEYRETYGYRNIKSGIYERNNRSGYGIDAVKCRLEKVYEPFLIWMSGKIIFQQLLFQPIYILPGDMKNFCNFRVCFILIEKQGQNFIFCTLCRKTLDIRSNII